MTSESPVRSVLVLRLLVVWSLALATVGCNPEERFGSHLRYAPSYRAYVLAPPTGSDEPPDEESVMVLVDPITERKIRCREELAKWSEPYRRHAADVAHDEGWEIASPFLVAPATVVAAAAFDVLLLSVAFVELPYQLARADEGIVSYERGLDAFERAAWDDAATAFELAMVKDRTLATHGLGRYYAGIAYANLGRSDEAREALAAFVERALVREITAYRAAERWLRYLDEPLERCASQEPLPIVW